VDASIFGQLIDYIYTRTVNITDDNVKQLLIHAERFLVRGLVERCCEFIKGNMSYSNCIGVLSFARQYYLADMEQSAWKFLLANFIQVEIMLSYRNIAGCFSVTYVNLSTTAWLTCLSMSKYLLLVSKLRFYFILSQNCQQFASSNGKICL
jgi:BTB/POZ domain